MYALRQRVRKDPLASEGTRDTRGYKRELGQGSVVCIRLKKKRKRKRARAGRNKESGLYVKRIRDMEYMDPRVRRV